VEKSVNRTQLTNELWRRGVLKWKLHTIQQEMYDLFYSSELRRHTWLLARRSGKSFTLVVLAIEQCLRHPKSIVKFMAPTKDQVESNVQPLFEKILEDCPEDLKPEYMGKKFAYKFKNGSQIQLAGTDKGHCERLRGGDAHLVIIDEAGFCDRLKYNYRSILLPTTFLTKGKFILASTPATESDHDFDDFVEEAQANNSLIKKTLYDNPMATPEMIADAIRESGGTEGEDFLREYMCIKVKSASTSVIPEFDEVLKSKIVKTWPTPPHFDAYISMDVGFKDMTVVLFGYYDFRADRLVIQREITRTGNDVKLPQLAEDIMATEDELWSNAFSGETKEPYLRVSDIDYIVMSELSAYSQGRLNFVATSKDNKDAAINDLRVALAAEKIIIDPSCTTLIYHLENVKRKNPNTHLFARGKDGSHFDACFIPGSKVTTSTGLKNIEDIVPGDKVLTHLGNFKPVKELLSRDYSGDILEVRPSGRESIFCTPDHKFWTSELKRTSSKKLGLTGQLSVRNTDWVKAEDLILSKSFDGKSGVYSPYVNVVGDIELSDEMCFLYGYYVAEGSVGGNGHQIQFAGHTKEKNVINIINEALYKEYGYGHDGTSNATKYRRKSGQSMHRNRKARWQEKGNSRRINISQPELRGELMKLGKSINKKFPDWIYRLNEEQAFYMLSGYLFGDGHFATSGIKAGSVSQDIIYGVQLLASICGVMGSIHLAKRKGRWKGLSKTGMIENDQWIISFTKEISEAFVNKLQNTPALSDVFEDKLIHPIECINYSNLPHNVHVISDKTTTTYEGKVYSMEVEDDHSYTINGVAVKNCDALIYMNRNVVYGKNPYPADYGYSKANAYHSNAQPNNQIEAYKKIFGVKSRRK